jgi:hypothetical protein
MQPDLAERSFTASGPKQSWVAKITRCRTFAGRVHTASVTDVYPGGSRRQSNGRTCSRTCLRRILPSNERGVSLICTIRRGTL